MLQWKFFFLNGDEWKYKCFDSQTSVTTRVSHMRFASTWMNAKPDGGKPFAEWIIWGKSGLVLHVIKSEETMNSAQPQQTPQDKQRYELAQKIQNSSITLRGKRCLIGHNLWAGADCVFQYVMCCGWIKLLLVLGGNEEAGCVQLFELSWLRISQCVNYKAR